MRAPHSTLFLLIVLLFPSDSSPKGVSQCAYLSSLPVNTDLKTIETQLKLPSPYKTLMGNSFYTDRIFEYVIGPRKGLIRIGIKEDSLGTLRFNGDYGVSVAGDSCDKWTDLPAPCDTVMLSGQEVVEHNYDGGAILKGVFCLGELTNIHLEIGISNGFYITDFLISAGRLVQINDIEEMFPYVDSLGTFDYKTLNPVYEVKYEIKNSKLSKLVEKGQRTLGESLDTNDQTTKYLNDFSAYYKAVQEKKARAKKR